MGQNKILQRDPKFFEKSAEDLAQVDKAKAPSLFRCPFTGKHKITTSVDGIDKNRWSSGDNKSHTASQRSLSVAACHFTYLECYSASCF